MTRKGQIEPAGQTAASRFNLSFTYEIRKNGKNYAQNEQALAYNGDDLV